jgi:hypothetical protein
VSASGWMPQTASRSTAPGAGDGGEGAASTAGAVLSLRALLEHPAGDAVEALGGGARHEIGEPGGRDEVHPSLAAPLRVGPCLRRPGDRGADEQAGGAPAGQPQAFVVAGVAALDDDEVARADVLDGGAVNRGVLGGQPVVAFRGGQLRVRPGEVHVGVDVAAVPAPARRKRCQPQVTDRRDRGWPLRGWRVEPGGWRRVPVYLAAVEAGTDERGLQLGRQRAGGGGEGLADPVSGTSDAGAERSGQIGRQGQDHRRTVARCPTPGPGNSLEGRPRCGCTMSRLGQHSSPHPAAHREALPATTVATRANYPGAGSCAEGASELSIPSPTLQNRASLARVTNDQEARHGQPR